MRNAPSLKFSDSFYDCAFLVSGFDTVEESASVFVLDTTWAKLERAKDYAREKNTGSNQARGFYREEPGGDTKELMIGGMAFQIKPHGGDGVAFILSNDQYIVAVRPAKVQYNLSVKIRAATLWTQGGPQAARKRIWDALLQEMKPRPVKSENVDADVSDWRILSRADYAWDFHSPEMTDEIGPEMFGRLICHQETKWRWDFKLKEIKDGFDSDGRDGDPEGYIMGRGGRVQTMTVGKKDYLQTQLYKKTDEITEKSQKTWMYKLWERAGLESGPDGRHHDVWRIEVRFAREYLKVRGISTFEDFEYHQKRLLAEALKSRRLTDRTGDSNRRRWPVHPMWAQAIEMAGNSMEILSLEHHREQAPEIIMEKMKQDMKAIMRRLSALQTGGCDYDWREVHNFVATVTHEIEADENHDDKMEEYAERYRYVRAPL